MIWVFWISLILIAYSLFGYGLVWAALAAMFGRRPFTHPEQAVSATVLIAARNEEAAIADKLRSVLALDTGPHQVRVLVVSDGSQDRTQSEAQSVGDARVTVFQTPEHGGKAKALNAGLERIDDDIVIFSDANSMLADGALLALLGHFSDPAVGGVCGQPEPLPSSRSGWLYKVEKLFWRYDSSLKKAESVLGGAVSAQGTLYAVRRGLLPHFVPDAMADDFFISVQVPAAHKRLVYEPRAVAREELTPKTRDEFMRRVRSTERGWRGLMAMRRLLNPFDHGLYALQLLSHKALRRLVAFLLPVMLVSNLALAGNGVFYDVLMAGQLIVYGLALATMVLPATLRIPGAKICAFFVIGHFAMALGILRVMRGVQSQRWSPVRNESP